jgi:hypothetical protein
LKADQWRNLVNVLPVALYCAWQINDEIPDADAPRPASRTNAAKAEKKKEALLASRRREDRAAAMDIEYLEEDQDYALGEHQGQMSRNYRDHYECVLDHCSSVRIYASRSITPNEILRAKERHSRACRNWALMKCHLTPNFHLSEHNPDFLLAYGPPYGYWGYPMEQHNGFLKSFCHNGHPASELEATLLRAWIKNSLVSDLVCIGNRISVTHLKPAADISSEVAGRSHSR